MQLAIVFEMEKKIESFFTTDSAEMVDMSNFLNLEYIMLEKVLNCPKHDAEVIFTREGAVKTEMLVGFEVKCRIEMLQEAWLAHTDERKKV